MFRKPKRKVKQGLRQRQDGEAETTGESAENTTDLVSQARKRLKNSTSSSSATTTKQAGAVMHSFETQKDQQVSNADLATSTVQHLPEALTQKGAEETAAKGADGIFRDTTRNKFHAGPVRASQNIRVTARFDFEPNICKDYKETGFCGYGDTCIYLHDRGDTMSGWQLEQQWEEQQRKKKEQQEKEIEGFVNKMTGQVASDDADRKIATDDGLPFACFLCREHFKQPVVTTCNHYFCESCIMNHVRNVSEKCPICEQDTGSLFNQPTKLVAKKRRILGVRMAKADNSWEKFAESFSTSQKSNHED